jgi:hypothetical protein
VHALFRWEDLFDLAGRNYEEEPAEEAGAHGDGVRLLDARAASQLLDEAHPTVRRIDAETLTAPEPVAETATAGPK